jgi:hypothetical protein
LSLTGAALQHGARGAALLSVSLISFAVEYA